MGIDYGARVIFGLLITEKDIIAKSEGKWCAYCECLRDGCHCYSCGERLTDKPPIDWEGDIDGELEGWHGEKKSSLTLVQLDDEENVVGLRKTLTNTESGRSSSSYVASFNPVDVSPEELKPLKAFCKKHGIKYKKPKWLVICIAG